MDKWTVRAALEPAGLPWTTLRVAHRTGQRFLVHAQALLERPRAKGEDLNAYLDGLFANALERCAIDADHAPDGYKVLAMQSLVMARLAGFLAGPVALNEDPLRKLMEATMLGYAEADAVPERGHHGHEHGHGHEHETDDHGHTHDDGKHGRGPRR